MREKARQIASMGIAGLCLVLLAGVACQKPPEPEPEPRPGALLSDRESVKVRVEPRDSAGAANGYQQDAGQEVTAKDPGAYTDETPAATEIGLAMTLEFNPPATEAAIIYFFTEGEGPEPGRPDAVYWEFGNLPDGHTAYITPKEGSSPDLFPLQVIDEEGTLGFAVKAPGADTIYSGRPSKAHTPALFEAIQKDFSEGEQPYVSWFYNVVVVDEGGNVVAEYDPEIRVMKHP
jgi:hypothetical protein